MKKDFTGNPATAFLQGIQEPKKEKKVRETADSIITQEEIEAPKVSGAITKSYRTTVIKKEPQEKGPKEIRDHRLQVVMKPSLYNDLKELVKVQEEKSLNDLVNRVLTDYVKRHK